MKIREMNCDLREEREQGSKGGGVILIPPPESFAPRYLFAASY